MHSRSVNHFSDRINIILPLLGAFLRRHFATFDHLLLVSVPASLPVDIPCPRFALYLEVHLPVSIPLKIASKKKKKKIIRVFSVFQEIAYPRLEKNNHPFSSASIFRTFPSIILSFAFKHQLWKASLAQAFVSFFSGFSSHFLEEHVENGLSTLNSPNVEFSEK